MREKTESKEARELFIALKISDKELGIYLLL